jgi:protein-disulfide isomerase
MGRYLPEAERTSTLVSAGLDQQQYTQCMNEGWYVSKIKQDMAEGEARGINGTPSLYLGTMHLQPTSFESFFELLENGLKQK